MAEAKRSLLAHYLNSTPATTASTWELMGEGISELTMNYNPQTETEQYIHEDTATTLVTGYQPSVPVTQKVYPGDDLFDFIDAIRQAGPSILTGDVADTSVTELVEVRLYEGATTSNTYPASRWTVQISIDSIGGEGGGKAEIGFTLNIQGDLTEGTFNTSTLAFTAS